MLAFDDRGSGDPLVLVHGNSCDMVHWEPVVDLLESEFRCVRVDLPGHGRTGGAAVDLFTQAAAIHEVVKHLGVADPVLVGHSAGGITSFVYALSHPARGLVVVDQPFDLMAFASRLAPFKERLLDPVRFEGAFEEWTEFFRLDLVPDEWQTLLRDHINPRHEVFLVMGHDVIVGEASQAQEQIEGALPALGVPSLHVYTAEWSLEEERLLDLAPHAQHEVWDGHGHFVQLEDPDRMADRIREFVAGL